MMQIAEEGGLPQIFVNVHCGEIYGFFHCVIDLPEPYFRFGFKRRLSVECDLNELASRPSNGGI